ncbi:MAG TPA: hypothetical protein VFZ33_19715 [Chitinophagaceae bacterium]
MKKLSLFFAVLFTAFCINAQNVSINNDGSTAASSAMLDVKSTTKGFMMPRVTSAQRTTIASPALGLLVFDTDTKTIWTYDGSAWKNLYNNGGGGSLTLPYSQSVNVAGNAFSITNSAGGAIEGITNVASSNGIRGIATINGSNGVYGGTTASNGVGVRGESNTGTGIIAYGGSGIGLSASSLSGTGIYTSSTSGLALNVNGNLKIAGGNTNPSNGAVLTSDASGNATWKSNRIGFHALGINTSHDDLQSGNWYTVIFSSEAYDFANNFAAYGGTAIPAPVDASTFAVPITGVYHLESYLSLRINGQTAAEVSASIRIKIVRNTSTFYIETLPAVEKNYHSWFDATFVLFKISSDYLLQPGDKVSVEITHYNDDGANASIEHDYNYRFSGRLAIPY